MRRSQSMWGIAFCLLLGAAPLAVFSDEDKPPYQTVNLTGSFNDWNPNDPTNRMTYVGDQVYRLTRFFRAGEYQFKVTINGDWGKHFGGGPNGVLAQPGSDIVLRIGRHGAYTIEIDFKSRRWKIAPAPLDAPHAVLIARGPAEIDFRITLDGSESVAREGAEILDYEFGQDTNDPVQVKLTPNKKKHSEVTVRLPKEGTYRFWLKVNDGTFSAPDTVTLKPEPSYQIVGDWTSADPNDPATFLERKAPGVFGKILKTTEAGDRQMILVRNHDAGAIVDNLTVSVTQTNQQFWRVRYDERAKKLTCAPENIFEFAYRPEDDPRVHDGNITVQSVSLVGSFNNWNPAAAPMTDRGDGTYVAYVTLDDGLHEYKYLINGNVWLQDPNADASLAREDGHGGMNSGVFIGERGQDFGPVLPQHVNFDALRHRPESPRYFNVVANDLVEMKLRTLHDDASQVLLHVLDGQERVVPMRVTDSGFGFDYWDASVFSASGTNAISYFFTLTDGPTNFTYGAAEDKGSKLGVKPFTAEMKAVFTTPDWAKNAVWYQIFPDRFRNATTENDPPRCVPWRWDWYKCTAWETPTQDRKFSNDWYGRRFGGDVQGLIEKLPYFRDLGVTALYLCPMFEANSYHGYDTVDYRHISQYFGFRGDNEKVIPQETLDPATWQWTPSDKLFLEFLKKAHEQGLKVILDGVFNHMGKGSFALRDVLSNGVNSVYADWFDITDWGPPVRYKSWDGGGWMPNFRKDAEKGYASDSAKKYVFDITKRWMDPNGDGDASDGVDGWRLDVAPDVPAAFWRDWRKLVKGINSNAYITGEDWGVATKHLQGDEWDAVMNYQFAIRAARFFIDQKRKITATQFDRQLKELLAFYPMQADMAMQNLFDSHDTDRLVNMIINPDRDYKNCSRPQDGCPYNGAKPGTDAYRVLKLMVSFQMTFLGAPMIWYGDEAGMFGADDPTNRKPMLWKDLEPYDNPQDFVMPDVLEHYRKLIAIRNSYPALRTGLIQTLLTDDARDLYGFTRTRVDQVVAVVFNNSARDQIAEIPSPFSNGARVIDLMTAPAEFYQAPMASLGFVGFGTNDTVRAMRLTPSAMEGYVARDGKLRVKLARKSAAILVKQ